MLLYESHAIVMQEVPNEVSLAINIAGCPHRCKNCHSQHLQSQHYPALTPQIIDDLLQKYDKEITCVCFMGGDADYTTLSYFAAYVKRRGYKTAVYSGDDNASKFFIDYLIWDYVKIGHYDQNKGPINKPTTNQRMYLVEGTNSIHVTDITNKFWKA